MRATSSCCAWKSPRTRETGREREREKDAQRKRGRNRQRWVRIQAHSHRTTVIKPLNGQHIHGFVECLVLTGFPTEKNIKTQANT